MSVVVIIIFVTDAPTMMMIINIMMMNNDGDGDSHGGGDDVVCVADVADVAKPVGLLTFQGSVIYSFLVTLILLHLHLFHYVFTYCVYMM